MLYTDLILERRVKSDEDDAFKRVRDTTHIIRNSSTRVCTAYRCTIRYRYVCVPAPPGVSFYRVSCPRLRFGVFLPPVLPAPPGVFEPVLLAVGPPRGACVPVLYCTGMCPVCVPASPMSCYRYFPQHATKWISAVQPSFVTTMAVVVGKLAQIRQMRCKG